MAGWTRRAICFFSGFPIRKRAQPGISGGGFFAIRRYAQSSTRTAAAAHAADAVATRAVHRSFRMPASGAANMPLSSAKLSW